MRIPKKIQKYNAHAFKVTYYTQYVYCTVKSVDESAQIPFGPLLVFFSIDSSRHNIFYCAL